MRISGFQHYAVLLSGGSGRKMSAFPKKVVLEEKNLNIF